MFEKAKNTNPQDWAEESQTNRPALKALLAALYEPVIREWWQQLKQDGQDLPSDLGSGEDILGCTHVAGITPPLTRHSVLKAPAASCDFLYTRIWSTERADHSSWLEATGQRLRAGGVWLAACMPLSGFRAYPHNYAFVRTMDLISQLEEVLHSETEAQASLPDQLQQAGFSILKSGHAHPAFIPRHCNPLAALLLERYRSNILIHKLARDAELDALLPELQRFQQAQDTLISRPGILQVLACRPNPISLTNTVII